MSFAGWLAFFFAAGGGCFLMARTPLEPPEPDATDLVAPPPAAGFLVTDRLPVARLPDVDVVVLPLVLVLLAVFTGFVATWHPRGC